MILIFIRVELVKREKMYTAIAIVMVSCADTPILPSKLPFIDSYSWDIISSLQNNEIPKSDWLIG